MVMMLAAVTGASAAVVTSPALADAPTATERSFAPKRAPEHLRRAELGEIGAKLVRSLAADAPLDQADLALWLRHQGGSLARLLETTGVDPAKLLHGAMEHAEAMGGPFIARGDMADDPLPAIDMAALVAQVVATVPLQSPVVDAHRLTSGFGYRRDPFHGRTAFHRGIDLAGKRGTPIYAPAAGTVLKVGRLGGYGNVVEIDHGNGVVTRYAHLHAYHVRRGDVVAPGDRLGAMGRSGRATGVHLHYEVMVDGHYVDPARFLAVGREFQSEQS